MEQQTKVLFFAEGATLAHVTRPLALARSLTPSEFDVSFARPKEFAWLTSDESFKSLDLRCQESAVFARRLEQGSPLYDFQCLLRYVENDLELIDAEKPEIVVGDFRLSLSVSARIRRIPYITICDAYWSPELRVRPSLPVFSWTGFVPLVLAKMAFRVASGTAFRLHAIPMERLRKHFGLHSLGFDLRRCYTDADLRLYANFKALFDEIPACADAEFIGPLTWSPRFSQPLDFLPAKEPLVYVTMGSSGAADVLENVIPVLEDAGHRVVLATAGRVPAERFASARTQVFDYLPGEEVCRHASLVVCNGGSPTTNQALLHGVPVLGICRNMDQFLNMQAIERFGAGISMRSDRAKRSPLAKAIHRLVAEPVFKERAAQLAHSAACSSSVGSRFREHLYRIHQRRN